MKTELGYPVQQQRLVIIDIFTVIMDIFTVIMDIFTEQVNDTLHHLLKGNNFNSAIIPHNLTDEFQHLNISVNKPS